MKFRVHLSRRANRDLGEIWDYNAEHRNLRDADTWDAFLRNSIEELGGDPYLGKPVRRRPGLRCLLMRKRNAKDGHIAVYSIDHATATVEVMFIFHTKQDWENKL